MEGFLAVYNISRKEDDLGDWNKTAFNSHVGTFIALLQAHATNSQVIWGTQ